MDCSGWQGSDPPLVEVTLVMAEYERFPEKVEYLHRR
jgi:hypothetical protein